MSPATTLIVYCLLISLASLAGGWIPLVLKLTHKRMELAVSFVAGVMLGVGLLHMLPHAIETKWAADHAHDHIAHEIIIPLMLWVLAGFLAMFLIERFFCFHHHDAPAPDSANGHDHANGKCGHDRTHSSAPAGRRSHHLRWTGAAIGLGIHSVIEGVALGASMAAAGSGHGGAQREAMALASLGTFLVIFLHKPFDSMTLATLMTAANRSGIRLHLVNLAFSLLIPLGVFLFQLGLLGVSDTPAPARWISIALAFSAGTFLCIAMSDLLPELQFHQHDRGKLSAALLAGLAVAWVIATLEGRVHEEANLGGTALPRGLAIETASERE